ncbi:tail fiber protein [Escherichia coli]|uniref:tail fiber protein n=1 Tax=Escherichia coli TaxID=562 RepID=UPI0039655CD4
MKAKNVGAFALGKTGNTVANDKSVGWNWDSGAYNANIGGASTLIIHFYNINAGSCPAVQFRVNYKNGGIFYRSARDGYGFEADWSDFYTTTRKPSAGDVGAYAVIRWSTECLLQVSEHPVICSDIRLYWVIMTGFKQNGDGNLDVYANRDPCYALQHRKHSK